MTPEITLPGEQLAVEEEAIPVSNAYVDEGGYIRASIIGLPSFDKLKKTIYVKPLVKRDVLLKPGTIVEGLVVAASEDLAFIDIYSANGARVRAQGVLHVSQCSETKINALLEVVKPGDYVRAKVLNNLPPYQLSLKEPGLGVIEAYCSICGSPLYKSGDKLQCGSCGNIETRKIGGTYVYILR